MKEDSRMRRQSASKETEYNPKTENGEKTKETKAAGWTIRGLQALGLVCALSAGVFLASPMMVQAGPASEAAGGNAGETAGSGSAGTEHAAAEESSGGSGLAADDSLLAAAAVWQQNGGDWYLVGPDGIPLTGWQRKDGAWYYLEANGVMATGWKQIDGSYYYLREDGSMQNATLRKDGTQYTFRADGALSSARKEKNTGGGSYEIAFFDGASQELADGLNELKADSFEGDEEEDYYEDDKKDYDKDASYILNSKLQEIAEHRLLMARTKGYGSGRIPDEGTLSDYLKSIRYESGRRILEVYLINCDGASAAEEKLLRNHDSDEKKRSDRAVYYKEMGIAHEEVNGKDYYMVIFMR